MRVPGPYDIGIDGKQRSGCSLSVCSSSLDLEGPPFLSIANGLQGSSSLKKEMTASRVLISLPCPKFALFWSVSSAQERAGFLRSSFE